jgi:CRP-like cAMP-binding protein
MMGIDTALLRGLSVFRDLSRDQLEKVANLCTENPVFPGEAFIREGEPGKTIFVIPRGEIEILYTAGGEAMACREWVKAGEVLGVRSLAPPYRYTTTVRCITDGTLIAIDAIKLGELFQQDGRLAKCMSGCLMRAILNRNATFRSLL